jgi:hypothetical protein
MTMRSLREAQVALREAILAEEGPGDLSGTGPSEGITIYRNAYPSRLAGALRVNYPVLAQLLGEAGFRRAADAYARAYPSRHPSIRWHGAELWRTLEAGPIAELARMEWALGTAFDAADARSLDVAFLGTHPVEQWADLRVALHPSVTVLEMSWAVEPQWEAIRGGHEPPVAERSAHALIVWRMRLQAHWRIASAEEGSALLALGACGTLQSACEVLGDVSPETVGAWFARWASDGLLARQA